MTDHPFHRVIGKLVNDRIIEQNDSLKIEPLKLWQDKACDPTDGQTIALYSRIADDDSKPVELCNVDMLIEIGGKAKVIIEIEKANVTPVHIFGKFFVSAFCDDYKTKGIGPKSFATPALFVQILESREGKRKSLKPRQMERIADSIGDIFTSRFHARKWEYRLFHGSTEDFEKGNKGNELVSAVRKFLEQKS